MRRVRSSPELASSYDLVIVGAGPAGMAAGSTAAGMGLSVLLADENQTPGGQIYRGVTTTPVKNRSVLGKHYWHGLELTDAMDRSDLTYAPGATVWSAGRMEGEGDPEAVEVGLSIGGVARIVHARHLLLATGALERPFPVPGWTLPGVMTAGGAQIALKTAGLVPGGRTVLAGCGPLLHVLGAQLRAAGTDIVALLDTTPRRNLRSALAGMPGFLVSPYVVPGLQLLRAAYGIKRFKGVTGLRIEGDEAVAGISFERRGRTRTIACDHVLLHQGVVPNVNMASALGCELAWDKAQHAWAPRVDAWCNATAASISVAGDGAGIGGAQSAAHRGEVAAYEIARRLGVLDEAGRDARSARSRRALTVAMRGRRFVDALYRPAQAFLAPPDPETIVCRCEEITAGQIRTTTRELKVSGPNQLKAFLRCGMGPCQGRLCASTVTNIIAEERGLLPGEIGHQKLRIPVKPITLAEIASLPRSPKAINAVMRS
jgi:NADPH-dependent 2,4-dienoyl-CoA reductase/sulfur reductase-like enzyme